MTPFARNLKRLRLEKEWTQATLAKKARMPSAQLSHYETGRREPNLENLRALQEALGCGYPEFFTNTK